MKTRYLLILVLAALFIAGAGVIVQQQVFAKDAKKVDFKLKNVEGKTVKLSSYRGKVVVVDVWATWCGYCVKEIPDLIELQAEAKKNKTPLQIIGVSVDKDKDAVKKFVKKHGINYPIVFDDGKALKQFGDVYGLPTKFIVNKKGEVVDTIIGAVSKKDLHNKLEKHLK